MPGTVFISKKVGAAEIKDPDGELSRSDVTVLRLMGFKPGLDAGSYLNTSNPDQVIRVSDYLRKKGYAINTNPELSEALEQFKELDEAYRESKETGLAIKSKTLHEMVSPPSFDPHVKIKQYQIMPILHMIKVKHAANFSVPGSGKTLMTYAAYDILKQEGAVDSLLVVGPISSFGPWEDEYRFCMNGNPDKSMLRYLGTKRSDFLRSLVSYDVVLTSYGTASNDAAYLMMHLMEKKKVMMVVDESHHIKSFSDDATYATRMIELGRKAARRYILSGTPVPRSFEDLWSQVTFLWPAKNVFGTRAAYKSMLEQMDAHERVSELTKFLWTRVTNEDLKEDMPNILDRETVLVRMSPAQENIYKAVELDTYSAEHAHFGLGDPGRFRLNRILRLMQSATNPAVMAARDHELGLTDFRPNDLGLRSAVAGYREIPPKVSEAARRALEVTRSGANAVVWTVFVKNVEAVCDEIRRQDPGADPIGISGAISADSNEEKDIAGREELIRNFKGSSGRVLVATVGSVAESISLHRACQRAIYLERSFNAGQYMQSLSRIYRIGSDKSKPVKFTFLKSAFGDGDDDTVDKKIGRVLDDRIAQLHALLNDRFKLYPLDLEAPIYADDLQPVYESISCMIRKHKESGRI